MNQPPDYYYVLQIFVPAVMIAAGWYVLYTNALRIENRKEAREFVEDIECLIDKIYDDVIFYYVESPQHSGHRPALIKTNFQLISHYLFVLKGLGLDPRCGTLLTQFRKNATGGFFETKDFKKQCDIPGWDAEISGAAAQLKLALRQAYYRWTKSYSPPALAKIAPWSK